DRKPEHRDAAGIIARTLDSNGGNAGHITDNADNLSILNSGVISTSTFGNGAAGEVLVNASGKLVIDGAGTPSFGAGIASSANFRRRERGHGGGQHRQPVAFAWRRNPEPDLWFGQWRGCRRG